MYSWMCHITILFFFASFFVFLCVFFFNDTATTEIYTLSLHDALPICAWALLFARLVLGLIFFMAGVWKVFQTPAIDRKSTRLNSSHVSISYAVFCLKKKKKKTIHTTFLYSYPFKNLTKLSILIFSIS